MAGKHFPDIEQPLHSTTEYGCEIGKLLHGMMSSEPGWRTICGAMLSVIFEGNVFCSKGYVDNNPELFKDSRVLARFDLQVRRVVAAARLRVS
ncbi:MAG TPA: hypothetical protein VLH19_01325 [Patescibacteria group bacterium]|nr:hypothetical protein [Patescibacteria group bacterium]